MAERLALPEEILLSVEKPERYLGNEVNAVHKDPEKISIRFVMCFPDVYEIGMSHLGIQILYDMFNARPDDIRPAGAGKMRRAHGGCLGTGRRRRTWQAAISRGEAQTAPDPRISEWGNPPGRAPGHGATNT